MPLPYRQIYISVVYNSAILPFDFAHFQRAISQLAYVLEPAQQPNVVPVPMARKGTTSLFLDQWRSGIAVSAQDSKSTVAEMDSLESLLKGELHFDSRSVARYYEFLAELVVRSRSNPLDRMSKAVQGSIIEDFSKVVGAEMVPFGLRLARRGGGDPRGASWRLLAIEPLMNSPTDSYYINSVLRDPARDVVSQHATNFEDLVNQLMALVER